MLAPTMASALSPEQGSVIGSGPGNGRKANLLTAS